MERILIVDDGRENREFIAEYILEPNGYQPLMASDGKTGLEMALSLRPDLILLDFQLPQMDGLQVLEALAAHNVSIPVIMMTFYGSEEVAVEVYRLGVRDYLKKPFSVDEMLFAIRRCLGEGWLRRERETLTERLIQANRELQQRVQELNVLYGVGKSVTSLTDLDQLLPSLVDAATRLTNAEEGQLHLLEDGVLVCRAVKRHTMPQAVTANDLAQDAVAQHVITAGQTLILTPEQIGASARDPARAPLSVVAAPLRMYESVIGVLTVTNVSPQARVFTKHDSALLSTLTDYAAIAIENARNYAALKQAKELQP